MTPKKFAVAVYEIDQSRNLRKRRLELLPVHDAGKLVGPGWALADSGVIRDEVRTRRLMGSISRRGIQQPILLEQDRGDTAGPLRLRFGIRRVMSCKVGIEEEPENYNFATVPALVCPGPMASSDVEAMQRVHDLACGNLQAGDIAEGLLLDRCSVLAAGLKTAGVRIPESVFDQRSIDRWPALVSLASAAGLGGKVQASWDEAIQRLGLRLNARKARKLVAIFRTLPQEITDQMDSLAIAVRVRSDYANWYRTDPARASALWASTARSACLDR